MMQKKRFSDDITLTLSPLAPNAHALETNPTRLYPSSPPPHRGYTMFHFPMCTSASGIEISLFEFPHWGI